MKQKGSFRPHLGPEHKDLKNLLVSGKNIYCVEKCLSQDGVNVINSPVNTCGNCPIVNHYGNLSAMSISLTHGETVFGILSVSIPANLARNESEQSLLQEVADDIAFALHNMRAEREARLGREKERVLAEMLDIAPSSITIHGTDGAFLFANQKTYAMHGYTQSEFMDINLHDLDVPESEQLLAERFSLIAKEGEARFDVYHFHKDGTVFPLEVYAKKIIWKGKPAILSIATDITKRKEAEEKLKASEEKYRLLVENANDIHYSISWDGKFTYISSNWMQFMGEPAEKAIGKSFEPYVHPDDVHLCRNFLQKVLSTGEKQSGVEYRVRHCDGSWRWHFSNGSPLKDSSGVVIEFTGIARDITERKQAETTALEKTNFLTNISSQVPGMLFQFKMTVDGKFSVPYSSQGIRDIFGCTPEEVRDNFEPIFSAVHPDDKDLVMQAINESIQSLTPWKCEYRVQLPGQPIKWIFGNSIPEKQNDGSILWFGYDADVTKRKQADEAIDAERERLAVTLESIGDGVITTDTGGNIVLLNKAAQDMTGWLPSDAEGRPLFEVFNIVNEVTRERCDNPVEQVLRTGHTVELADHTALLTKDNREIIIADSAAPIKNTENDTIGVALVFRDMTEKKKLENALEVSSKLESLGVLAGGIAHDFNNLLGGIYGYIDMASESTKDETTSQYLSKTMFTIERARDLTQQLLTFAKGGAPVQMVAPLFPIVQKTAQFALSGSKVSCDFDIQPDMWNCNYDKNQIGQVIDNLIINAQQAMPVGGTIKVSARNISLDSKEHPALAKGNYVRIGIKDSGVGIPKELLDKIFDPFFTTKSKGHGLGLATCYSIVKRHGGSIDVYSEPGNGSLFTVYLPAADAPAETTETQSRTQHTGSGTFLVMDDEEVMRDILKDMLESFGYSVVCKGNGKDALEYLAAEIKADRQMSGMIFDLTVPGGMGGMEAIAELRKIDAKTPAFVASGYADGSIMKNPVEYGFTAGICKPFRRVELMEMLEKHMKKK